MEYVTDFLVWGIITGFLALGFIFLADWLIDREFEHNENSVENSADPFNSL